MRSRFPMLSATAARPVAVLLCSMLAAGCGAGTGTDVTPPASVPAPGGRTAPTPRSATPSAPAPSATSVTSAVTAAADGAAVFRPFGAGATAVTYDTAVVPKGATGAVAVTRTGSGVKVRLAVTGMKPHHGYGAHVHTDPCAAEPAAAGPHYQHLPDPKAVASPPSVDPTFANPRNEVWLDFTTDATGAAIVSATQAWPFDEISPPRSVILHATRTKTAAGTAGTAGPRVACLTLPL